MKSCSKGQRKGFRNKYLALIISMLLFFGAQAQVTPITYTPMNAAGYQMKYLKVDSGFALPFRDTSVSRGTNRPGLLVINSADSLPYYYNGSYWKPVYVDSAGVIALINNKVDSVTINGNTLFYWIAGLGYGQTINKIDSVTESGDSVFTWIGGNSTYAFQLTSGSGTVTQIISGFGLVSDTITSNGTILVDTSVIAAKSWATAQFAPISHTHSASDIISGTLPIARGGTGLSGIGGVGQMLKVASSGTALQYFTPNYASQSDVHDSIVANQDTVKYQFPIYASVDTVKLRTDSMPLLTYGPTVDSSSFTDNTLINRKYLSDRIAAVTATGIARAELQDTASAIRSAFPNISGKVNISDTASMLGHYFKDFSTPTDTTIDFQRGDGTTKTLTITGGGTVLNGTGYVKMSGTTPSYIPQIPLTTDVTGILPFANGGLGINSATNGDILYYNGGWQKLAIGTARQRLAVVSGLPAWVDTTASSGGGGVTSGTYSSMISSSPTDGQRWSLTDYLPGPWQYMVFDSTWHYLFPPTFSVTPNNAPPGTYTTSSGSGAGWSYYERETSVGAAGSSYSKTAFGQVSQYSTGSTASGSVNVAIGGQFQKWGFQNTYGAALRMKFGLQNTSTPADRFYVQLGAYNGAGSGLFFRYCDSLNSGKWQCIGMSGGSAFSTINTSVTADSSIHEFVVLFTPVNVNTPANQSSPHAANAYFYIDKTLVATMSSFSQVFIGSAQGLFSGFGINKTVGTNARALNFSNLEIFGYGSDR